MKQFEITVKILVSVNDDSDAGMVEDVMEIANHYAEMAVNYKSVGAEKILEVSAKEFVV